MGNRRKPMVVLVQEMDDDDQQSQEFLSHQKSLNKLISYSPRQLRISHRWCQPVTTNKLINLGLKCHHHNTAQFLPFSPYFSYLQRPYNRKSPYSFSIFCVAIEHQKLKMVNVITSFYHGNQSENWNFVGYLYNNITFKCNLNAFEHNVLRT